MAKLTGGTGWSLTPSDEPKRPAVPAKAEPPRAKFRMERRQGKAVTVVFGLESYGTARLEAMARELKTAMGSGGTVKNGAIEIQGDRVEEVKAWFQKRK